MRRAFCYLLVTVLPLTIGCNSDAVDPEPIWRNDPFVPTDVVLKTKAHFTVDKVFGFINSFDHTVEVMYGGKYISGLSSGQLDYVLDQMNTKPYIKYGAWSAYGYRHYQTDQITVFPRLHKMKTSGYQEDWLNTVQQLKLVEKTDEEIYGWVIYLHVPAGQEKEWVEEYRKYDFVEWADLNHISTVGPD